MERITRSQKRQTEQQQQEVQNLSQAPKTAKRRATSLTKKEKKLNTLQKKSKISHSKEKKIKQQSPEDGVSEQKQKLKSKRGSKCQKKNSSEIQESTIQEGIKPKFCEKQQSNKDQLLKQKKQQQLTKSFDLKEGLYTGNMYRNKKSGQGILKYKNGDIYEGEFKSDKKCGDGKYYYKNNNGIYTGKFKNDLGHGVGSFTHYKVVKKQEQNEEEEEEEQQYQEENEIQNVKTKEKENAKNQKKNQNKENEIHQKIVEEGIWFKGFLDEGSQLIYQKQYILNENKQMILKKVNPDSMQLKQSDQNSVLNRIFQEEEEEEEEEEKQQGKKYTKSQNVKQQKQENMKKNKYQVYKQEFDEQSDLLEEQQQLQNNFISEDFKQTQQQFESDKDQYQEEEEDQIQDLELSNFEFEWILIEEYKGKFHKGARHGQGSLQFGKVGKYEGKWENGKKSGLGEITQENGDKYKGQFQNDKYHGSGRFIPSDQSHIYEGDFVNGFKQGFGVQRFNLQQNAPNSIMRYEGNWNENLQDGLGLIYKRGGIREQGLWHKGDLQRIINDNESDDEGDANQNNLNNNLNNGILNNNHLFFPLQAFNRLNTQRGRLTKQEIDDIPKQKYSEFKKNAQNIQESQQIQQQQQSDNNNIDQGDLMCPICYQEYEEDHIIKEIKCKHFFHDLCIDKWLEIKCKCPICKVNLKPPQQQDQLQGLIQIFNLNNDIIIL